MMKRILFSIFGAMLLVTGAVGGNPALAASSCKGLVKSKCVGKPACSWVDSYKTKSGTHVKGHCRAKPGKGAKKHSTTSSKKEKASTKSKDSDERKSSHASGSNKTKGKEK